jgi:hypothetical protein
MKRSSVNFFLIATLWMAILINGPALLADDGRNPNIDTPEKAAAFASKLANEKCQKAFGVSPFTPDSYSAQQKGAKWCWGEIASPGIGGYSAEVEFNWDGTGRNVRTVLHTDMLDINLDTIKPPVQMDLID